MCRTRNQEGREEERLRERERDKERESESSLVYTPRACDTKRTPPVSEEHSYKGKPRTAKAKGRPW